MENQTQSQTTVTQTDTVAPAQVVKTEPLQKVYQTKKTLFRTYQVVWYVLGLIEVLLGFRIILKMLAANPYSGFANLIYSITNPLAMPFYGVFGITVSNQSVLEWSTIVAGIVYFLLAYGIIQLLQLVKPTNPVEVSQTVDT